MKGFTTVKGSGLSKLHETPSSLWGNCSTTEETEGYKNELRVLVPLHTEQGKTETSAKCILTDF